nr:hypothetical protein [Actinomadura macrotermitis]
MGTQAGELVMKRIVLVLIEVERKIKTRDEFGLEGPWLRMLNPADAGVVGHPGGQLRLAGFSECHEPAAADSPEFQAEQAPRVSRKVEPSAFPR